MPSRTCPRKSKQASRSAAKSSSRRCKRDLREANGRRKRNPRQDREYQEYSEDHQGHGNGGGEQDAQGAGSDARGAPLCGENPQDHRPPAPVNLDYKHPFTLERPVQAVGIVVISTDRGLCGSLNLNLFKAALAAIREAQAKNAKIYLCVIGSKALQFFRRLGGVEIAASVTHLGDKPRVAELIGTTKVMLDLYRDARIDQLLLVHNVFVNTMAQKGIASQLLPLQTIDKDEMQ